MDEQAVGGVESAEAPVLEAWTLGQETNGLDGAGGARQAVVREELEGLPDGRTISEGDFILVYQQRF